MKGRTVLNVVGRLADRPPPLPQRSQVGPESLLWLAQAAARRDGALVSLDRGQAGLGEDRRWHRPGQLFMQWLARNERHFFILLRRRRGVLFSQRMHLWYTPPAGETRHPG